MGELQMTETVDQEFYFRLQQDILECVEALSKLEATFDTIAFQNEGGTDNVVTVTVDKSFKEINALTFNLWDLYRCVRFAQCEKNMDITKRDKFYEMGKRLAMSRNYDGDF